MSTTINEDVNWVVRVPLVVSNLLIMFLSFLAFWAGLIALFSRPPDEGSFWQRLRSNAFFTVFMHLEVPIITGSIIVFTAASFGLLGALRENTTFLTLYNSFLLVFVLLLSVFAIVCTLFTAPIKRAVKDHYFRDFVLGYRENPDFQRIIDSIQGSLRCCGISDENFRDWNLNPYFRCEVDNPSNERCNVPFSCCRQNESLEALPNMFCGAKVLTLDDHMAWERIYIRSCADAAMSFIQNNIGPILVVCMISNFALLLLLTTSVMLRDEIFIMESIYEAYYDSVNYGVEKMKKRGIQLPPAQKLEEPSEVPKLLRILGEKLSLGKQSTASRKWYQLFRNH